MPLDAQTQALLEQMNAADAPPLHTLSPAAAREVMFQLAAMGGDPDPVAQIQDHAIPGLPATSRFASILLREMAHFRCLSFSTAVAGSSATATLMMYPAATWPTEHSA